MARAWRGAEWGDPDNLLGGFRLLILGESHYHETAPVGADLPGMTNDVVNGYLGGDNSHAFFSKIQRLITGRDLLHERRSFWDSVVFYNYIPVVAANAPSQRPPDAFWGGDAPGLFARLVKEIEAEAILVCGTTLWRRMPPGMIERADAYQAGGRFWREREYDVALPYRAVAAHIPHPTGTVGWSYERSQPVVRHLRERANAIRVEVGAPPLEKL